MGRATIGLATQSCRKSLGISPALMRLLQTSFYDISVPPNSVSSFSYAQDGTTSRSLETKSRANMAAMAKICNPVLRERIHFLN